MAVPLLSTVAPVPLGVIFYDGMSVISGTSDTMRVLPGLGRFGSRRFVPVKLWWTEPVYKRNDLLLSRNTIVLKAANQDGGAHVDKRLDPDYALFKSGVWSAATKGAVQVEEIPEPQLVFLRQMAYELLNSPALRDLVTHGSVAPGNMVFTSDAPPAFTPPQVESAAMSAMTVAEVNRLRGIVRQGHFGMLDNLYRSSSGAATNPLAHYQKDQQAGFQGDMVAWAASLIAEGLIEQGDRPELYRVTMRGRAFVGRVTEIGH